MTGGSRQIFTRSHLCMVEVVLIYMLFLSGIASAGSFVVNDGEFGAWTFGSYTTGTGASTASLAVTQSQGNPVPGLSNTTVTPSGTCAAGFGFDTTTSSTAVLLNAPFSMTIQFESGAGAFGQGQGVALVVVQDGVAYEANLKNTYLSSKWKNITVKGKFIAKRFSRISSSGPTYPDFSSGIATQFGFSATNCQSGTLTNLYDNYALTVTLP